MNKIDIDVIKQEIQRDGFKGYIPSIKFVTYENADVVISTIRKDLMSHKNVAKFMIFDNTIEMLLNTNLTLCIYYFIDTKVLNKVVEELPSFGINCQNRQTKQLNTPKDKYLK